MVDKKQKLVEIARSFSYKLNLGNYQTADFFCSQKAEMPEKDAVKMSEELYKFCEDEVMKSVHNYQLDHLPIETPKTPKQNFIEAKANAPAEQAKQEVADEIPPDDTNFEDEAITTLPTEEIESPKDAPDGYPE